MNPNKFLSILLWLQVTIVYARHKIAEFGSKIYKKGKSSDSPRGFELERRRKDD
jgi:hypothetical protein